MDQAKISKIGFDVELSVVEFDDLSSDVPGASYTAPVALVRLLIDGQEPLRSTKERPFDAIEALSTVEEQGERFLYTCSCGESGCAGLFEGVHVGSDEGTVQFRFPGEAYEHMLEPSFKPPAGEDFVAVFDRKQYRQAFEELEQGLKELEAQNPLMQVAPSSADSPDEESSFSSLLRKVRAYRQAKESRKAFARETLGTFFDKDIFVAAPEGEFLLTARAWQGQLTGFWLNQPYDEEQMQVLRDTAELLAQPDTTCLEFLLSLDWEQTCGLMSLASLGTVGPFPEPIPALSPEYVARLRATWVQAT